MALLRPGRCCSRPQDGCLQHRTEVQRRPKGQDAGGTPALPGPPGRGGSFESETGVVSGKSGPRPPRRGGSFESETGFVSDKRDSGGACLAFHRRALRSRRMHLIRRLRGCGRRGTPRPRAHATADKSTPPWLLNATSPGVRVSREAAAAFSHWRKPLDWSVPPKLHLAAVTEQAPERFYFALGTEYTLLPAGPERALNDWN